MVVKLTDHNQENTPQNKFGKSFVLFFYIAWETYHSLGDFLVSSLTGSTGTPFLTPGGG